MNSVLIFILGVLAGAAAVRIFTAKTKPEPTRQKGGNLPKVLQFLASHGQLTNDDVQKLLGVSDATATRYLEELEKEGRIRQVGREGRGVHYEKI